MPQIACPNCGASVESTERACSYCGAALPASVSSSAPTVRASRDELDAMLKGPPPPAADATFVSSEPLKKFRSSAEAMDAVKSELRPGKNLKAHHQSVLVGAFEQHPRQDKLTIRADVVYVPM